MKIVVLFLSMPKQCTGIPVLIITLSHAHKCVTSDVIRHMSIFSLVMGFPGGSCMSDPGKKLSTNALQHDVSLVDIFRAKSKIALTGVRS